MRRKTFDLDRSNTFGDRARKFMEKLKKWAGGASTSGLPYLHIMLDHIGDLMIQWGSLLEWGYGYFSCTAGEHLNKRIKVEELSGTNLSNSRFADIIRNMRIKQFYYVNSICKEHKEITCSRCHEKGHNRKNKSCLLHPSQPNITFEVSDDENDKQMSI